MINQFLLFNFCPFYQEKKRNSCLLFGKLNDYEHLNIFSDFRLEQGNQFRGIINHFVNKLQINQQAELLIKQNLMSIYLWKNEKNELEVYCIDQSLSSDILFQNTIFNQTYQQFYEILQSLSGLNITKVQKNITCENFYQEIELLYDNIIKISKKELEKGYKDLQFQSLKIRTKNAFISRPNGNIIKLQKINNEIYNFNYVSIYISTSTPFCNPVCLEFDQQIFNYVGQIDQQTFLPNGYGKLLCEGVFNFNGKFQDGLATGNGQIDLTLQKQKFEGIFQNGLKHGESTTTNPNQTITTGYYQNNMKQGEFVTKKQNGFILQESYYRNDQVVKKNQCIIDQNTKPTNYIAYHKNISINNHFFSCLTDGKWVNQLIVDYYLKILSDYYKNVSKVQIHLFDTVQSQDMFSSQISQLDHQSIKLQKKYEQIINQYQQYEKIVFILNADQVHFLVLVYQNESLYMLNSYVTQNDHKILSTVASIFPNKLHLQQIEVEQQQNTYDCSLYSIYNVMLQYKYNYMDVDKIDYRVSSKYIKQLRLHLKNVIINDYNHIILQKKN